MRKFFGILIITILVVIFVNIFKKEVWSGYFYPERSNLSDWIESNETFNSLEECRYWAEDTASELNLEINSYDYECGLNCKYKNGFNVCEKTLN